MRGLLILAAVVVPLLIVTRGVTWLVRYLGQTDVSGEILAGLLLGRAFSVPSSPGSCTGCTPEQAMAQFRDLGRLVEGTNLPRIPEGLIDAILYERPLELVGLG